MYKILALIAVLSLSGCGIFKKNLTKISREQSSAVIERTYEASTTSMRSDLSQVELVELEARIKPDGEKIVKIRASKETIAQIVSEDKKETASEKEAVTTTKYKEKDLEKDSNTTAAANIPWYVWAMGFAFFFALAYLAGKRYRIF